MPGHVSLGQLKVMPAIELPSSASGGPCLALPRSAHTPRSRTTAAAIGTARSARAVREGNLAGRHARPTYRRCHAHHLVFTLPAPVSNIAYQNKAVIYDILFKTSAETLITIAADPEASRRLRRHHLGSPYLGFGASPITRTST